MKRFYSIGNAYQFDQTKAFSSLSIYWTAKDTWTKLQQSIQHSHIRDNKNKLDTMLMLVFDLLIARESVEDYLRPSGLSLLVLEAEFIAVGPDVLHESVLFDFSGDLDWYWNNVSKLGWMKRKTCMTKLFAWAQYRNSSYLHLSVLPMLHALDMINLIIFNYNFAESLLIIRLNKFILFYFY